MEPRAIWLEFAANIRFTCARIQGAIVRCFDTREAVREQVKSMGGEFIEVKLKVRE